MSDDAPHKCSGNFIKYDFRHFKCGERPQTLDRKDEPITPTVIGAKGTELFWPQFMRELVMI